MDLRTSPTPPPHYGTPSCAPRASRRASHNWFRCLCGTPRPNGMPVEVHQEYLKRRFVAPCCSCACGLNALIIVGAAILPLYIAWASHCEDSRR